MVSELGDNHDGRFSYFTDRGGVTFDEAGIVSGNGTATDSSSASEGRSFLRTHAGKIVGAIGVTTLSAAVTLSAVFGGESEVSTDPVSSEDISEIYFEDRTQDPGPAPEFTID